GTGPSQPEVIADLRARPPLYDDARNRLAALLKELLEPVRTSDPDLARQRLHDVMSQSRYDVLHRPPSPLERFVQWVQDRIRALCAGVAATLAGERSWEGSPLTVREIFQRAADYNSLRVLLLPFEAAVYGGRGVDEATYRKAEHVAATYRAKPAEAAA